jgi:two-component system chemotaxis response regulator CheY
MTAGGERELRVLVVDDDPRFASALRALLEAEGMSVVGYARNGVEAVERAEQLRPDVVSMDLLMPVMDGLEATRRIVPLGIPVVVLTGSRSRGVEAMKAGASAFVLKQDASSLLAPVLRMVVDSG